MWKKASKLSPYFDQPIGTKINVFFDYEATLNAYDPIFVNRIRKEFTIEIINPDEPIVAAYQDETAAQLVINSMGIGPLQIMSEIEDPEPNKYIDILTRTLSSEVGLP